MGFLSKITKPFKKIAKRIKKTASSVWKGVQTGILKPLGKLYGKTFGKLGPLGMVAASLILPGIGNMIAAGWTSMAGALGQAGAGSFLNAVSAGMNTISAGLSTVGTGISDTINSVMDSSKELFGKASEWVGAGKSPSAFTIKPDAGSLLSTPTAGPQSSFNLGLDKIKQGTFTGVQDTSTSAMASGVTGPQNLIGSVGPQPEFGSALGKLDVTPGSIAKTQVSRTGEVAVGTNQSFADAAGRAKTKAFAKKAAKGIAGSLLAQGAAPIEVPPIASLSTTDFSAFGSNRLGIGGQGAVGGQFLNQQQQAFFQKHSQILGQVG